MTQPTITIDVPALRTLLDLAEEHAAEWLVLSPRGTGFSVDLQNNENFDNTGGVPIKRCFVSNEGGSSEASP